MKVIIVSECKFCSSKNIEDLTWKDDFKGSHIVCNDCGSHLFGEDNARWYTKKRWNFLFNQSEKDK